MMGLKTTMLLSAAGLAAGIALATPVLADDDATALFGSDQQVAASDLAATRGMENIYDFDASLSAVLDNNQATDNGSVRTNTIDSTAFSGATGVATVIQNAGDNVIIQTVTQVTVNYY